MSRLITAAAARLTGSDLVGRVQIPVTELMSKPNQMHRREDSLMGFEDANDMPGEADSDSRGKAVADV